MISDYFGGRCFEWNGLIVGRTKIVFLIEYILLLTRKEKRRVDQRHYLECKFTGSTNRVDDLVKIENNLSMVWWIW